MSGRWNKPKRVVPIEDVPTQRMARRIVVPTIDSLQGIAEARTELFERVMRGEISDEKAIVCERMLRGQVMTKGDIPIGYLKLVVKLRGKVDGQALDAFRELEKFLSHGSTRRRAIDV